MYSTTIQIIYIGNTCPLKWIHVEHGSWDELIREIQQKIGEKSFSVKLASNNKPLKSEGYSEIFQAKVSPQLKVYVSNAIVQPAVACAAISDELQIGILCGKHNEVQCYFKVRILPSRQQYVGQFLKPSGSPYMDHCWSNSALQQHERQQRITHKRIRAACELRPGGHDLELTYSDSNQQSLLSRFHEWLRVQKDPSQPVTDPWAIRLLLHDSRGRPAPCEVYLTTDPERTDTLVAFVEPPLADAAPDGGDAHALTGSSGGRGGGGEETESSDEVGGRALQRFWERWMANAYRIPCEKTRDLLVRHKKLPLAFDIDDTLITSGEYNEASGVPPPPGARVAKRNPDRWMLLRPGLPHFLEGLRQHFVLGICTSASRCWADDFLDLLEEERRAAPGGQGGADQAVNDSLRGAGLDVNAAATATAAAAAYGDGGSASTGKDSDCGGRLFEERYVCALHRGKYPEAKKRFDKVFWDYLPEVCLGVDDRTVRGDWCVRDTPRIHPVQPFCEALGLAASGSVQVRPATRASRAAGGVPVLVVGGGVAMTDRELENEHEIWGQFLREYRSEFLAQFRDGVREFRPLEEIVRHCKERGYASLQRRAASPPPPAPEDAFEQRQTRSAAARAAAGDRPRRADSAGGDGSRSSSIDSVGSNGALRGARGRSEPGTAVAAAAAASPDPDMDSDLDDDPGRSAARAELNNTAAGPALPAPPDTGRVIRVGAFHPLRRETPTGDPQRAVAGDAGGVGNRSNRTAAAAAAAAHARQDVGTAALGALEAATSGGGVMTRKRSRS